MKSSKIFLALLILATPLSAVAQELTWALDYESTFDNREGDSDYTPAETLFFSNLAPEVGLQFSDSDRIAGGVVWNQPIGCEWDGALVSPTLYYRHDNAARWAVTMGMLPRTLLHEELPNFLWSDSLSYFQRNIRGILLQYTDRRSFVDFYLDWRQMQTETEREAFNIVVHGQWHPGNGDFFVGGNAMMNHFALTKNSTPDEHIVDNFVVNPYVGIDLSRATALDSLRVRAGALLTVERNRAYDDWSTPIGVWADVRAEWRWLGLYNSFYAGGRQMQSPGGSLLYQGEPFYRSKLYNRTDVYANVLRNRHVELKASLDFNITEGSFIFYQRLTLRIYLNNKIHKRVAL